MSVTRVLIVMFFERVHFPSPYFAKPRESWHQTVGNTYQLFTASMVTKPDAAYFSAAMVCHIAS